MTEVTEALAQTMAERDRWQAAARDSEILLRYLAEHGGGAVGWLLSDIPRAFRNDPRRGGVVALAAKLTQQPVPDERFSWRCPSCGCDQHGRRPEAGVCALCQGWTACEAQLAENALRGAS